MINTDLLVKILKVSGESPEKIAGLLSEFSDTVADMMTTGFVKFVEARTTDLAELDKLSKFIDSIENLNDSTFAEYDTWLKRNSAIKYEEFWTNFEKEVFDLQLQIINDVKKELSDEQKKEIIDFIEQQKLVLDKADQEYQVLMEKALMELNTRDQMQANPQPQM
jgi:hypothetical protein